MKNPESKAGPEPAEKIEQELLSQLPEIAKGIISDHPKNRNFKQNPDDSAEHEPKYHQFGIITHSQKIGEAYREEMPKLLRQWGVAEKIDAKLAEPIDGRTKAELLQISLPFHDLGKFTSPRRGQGKKEMRFHKDHEARSEKIIRNNDQVKDLLQQHGLTQTQIEYIARCAGLHYELGKMRQEAINSETGFSIAFAKSKKCKQACQKIAKECPEFEAEIGLYFLCDNLAKTDIQIDAKTNEEIEQQVPQAEQAIKEQGLNPRLIGTVKQMPINQALARTYLESIE